jgi:hypothetical protein
LPNFLLPAVGYQREGKFPQGRRSEKRKENIRMKRISIIMLLITMFPATTFPASQQKDQLLQATNAALVIQSLQLGDKAQELFSIKAGLLKIVKTKQGNLSAEGDMMIAAATEMKYIATVAYFEGNLLGAVLALKKEFRVQFIDNRILELENAIKGTNSSLELVKVAHSTVEDTSALGQLDKSIKAVEEILEIYRNSIEVLQKMKKKEFGQEEIRQPSN